MKSYCRMLINKYLTNIRWFVPLDLSNDEHSLVIAQIFVTLALLAVASMPFLALLYHFLNFDKGGIAVILGGVGMLCSLFVLKLSGRIAFAREVFICSFFCLKLWLSIYLGGIESPTLPWLLLCPMIAMVLGGMRPCATWGAVITLTVLGVFSLQTNGVVFPSAPISDQGFLHLVSMMLLFFFSSIILLLYRLALATSTGGIEMDRRPVGVGKRSTRAVGIGGASRTLWK